MEIEELPVPAQGQSPDTMYEELGQREMRWIVIRSRVLAGEEFVLVFDTSDVAKANRSEPGKVVYIPAEMEELLLQHWSKKSLQKIHKIKRTFNGLIIPRDCPLGQRLRRNLIWKQKSSVSVAGGMNKS